MRTATRELPESPPVAESSDAIISIKNLTKSFGSHTVLDLVENVAFGGLGWLLAVALALGPIPALLALGMWLDRCEPEPVWLLARTLLWGAAGATGGSST